MIHRTATPCARNPVLVALLLVAFCARALIPTGFMPGPGGLILCDGHMSAPSATASPAMVHDMSAMAMSGEDMAHHADHASQDGGSPAHPGSTFCPFAAAATPMASSHAASLLAVHSVVTKLDLPSARVVPRGTIVPTRLPRGPPSSAA